jgi:hypothetical protein
MVLNGHFGDYVVAPELYIDTSGPAPPEKQKQKREKKTAKTTNTNSKEKVSPQPEIDYSAVSFYNTAAQPMPNNITGCSTIGRSFTKSVTVGTEGAACLFIKDPNLMACSDADAMGSTTALFAGTDAPTSIAETGVSLTPGDSNSPYIGAPFLPNGSDNSCNFFWTPYLTVRMRSNSSALTAKQGRIYFGTSLEAEVTNEPSSTFDQLQTFKNYGVDQVAEKDMPMIRWIPTPTWSTHQEDSSDYMGAYPSIWVFGIGLVAGTILEFDISYQSVVCGMLVPFTKELEYNTDAVQGVLHALRETLPKGSSHTQAQAVTAHKAHAGSIAKRNLRSVPKVVHATLPTVTTGSSQAIVKQSTGSSISELVDDAIDAVPSLFERVGGLIGL